MKFTVTETRLVAPDLIDLTVNFFCCSNNAELTFRVVQCSFCFDELVESTDNASQKEITSVDLTVDQVGYLLLSGWFSEWSSQQQLQQE